MSRDVDEARRAYAARMAVAARSDDTRIEAAFREVPREDFLPPPPWRIYPGHYAALTSDPAALYQDMLIALDAARGINNGQPSLHAAWIGAVAPRAGETVVQVGAGGGYYTAILARLVAPGAVYAYEIDAGLAALAGRALAGYETVRVIAGDATAGPIPECDVIYVSAGVTVPPLGWLTALRLGGRLMFPWTPGGDWGVATLVTRRAAGFGVAHLFGVSFIPCVGASGREGCLKMPGYEDAFAVRSLWLTARRAPDDSALAVYRDVWFSGDDLQTQS